LDVEDLATLLRVSPETVRRRARTGEYPSVPGLRVRRFPRDLVLQILYSNPPPSSPY
jgi:helix-turn-helix protein